jgi:2-hydroxyglutarate dehydrogenase
MRAFPAKLAARLFKQCPFNKTLSTSATVETDTEVLVVGAGVVGLAIARQLAIAGRDVIIVDAAKSFGTETSSRSSEVIHAGLYYPKDSLKAHMCVQGKRLMYEYCTQREIPHRRLGKLLVATTEAQFPALQKLKTNAALNGVEDLQWLTSDQVKHLEPNISCISALLSPSTGIVDSHSLMAALLEDFESAGGTVAFNSKVESGIVGENSTENGKCTSKCTVVVKDVGSGEVISITSRYLINSAGLHAQNVAFSLKGLPNKSIPELFLAKGNYFVFSPPPQPTRSGTPKIRKFKFNHLIYPIPEPGTAGLGVHLTLDLSNGIRFGPDVEYLPPGTNPETIDYSVDPSRGSVFEEAARSFFPELPEGSLVPGYSGVRPKVVGPGQPAGDFIVAGPSVHGIDGVVNLFGIESPGLTSSLALAKLVERELV